MATLNQCRRKRNETKRSFFPLNVGAHSTYISARCRYFVEHLSFVRCQLPVALLRCVLLLSPSVSMFLFSIFMWIPNMCRYVFTLQPTWFFLACGFLLLFILKMQLCVVYVYTQRFIQNYAEPYVCGSIQRKGFITILIQVFRFENVCYLQTFLIIPNYIFLLFVSFHGISFMFCFLIFRIIC